MADNGQPFFDLSGKHALVTGATGPLGRALAVALADAGADVSVTTLSDDAGEETEANSILNECWSLGRKGEAKRVDLTDDAAVDAAVGELEDAIGPISILVNATHRANIKPVLESSLAEWEREIARNATSVFVASQAVALAILTLSTSTVAIWTWVAIWGVGGAFAPMLEPLLITRAFGVRHFGAVSGLMAVIAFGGQTLGPIGGAALFDATGSYDLSFALYVAGFAISFMLFAATSLALRSGSFRTAADRAGMSRARR